MSSRSAIRIYDAATDSAAAFRRALEEGCTFIVGPLSRDGVATARTVADGRIPVLALNHLPDGEVVPKHFYQFALAPEDEARQLANRALETGRHVGAVLVPSGDWGTRVRQAFAAAFTAGGGRITAAETYPTDTTDFSDLLEPLLGFEESQKRYKAVSGFAGGPLIFTPKRREDLEFIFFAGQPVHGRLLRPQLKFHYAGDLPVYATSDIYDPRASSNQDLEGVTFLDIPWLLSAKEPIAQLRESMSGLWAADSRHTGRLFALGFDACTLAERLRSEQSVDGVAGLTGLLTIAPNGRIHRTLLAAEFEADGSVRTLER
jgi:outer membrane PBP1 activator LpoA protein